MCPSTAFWSDETAGAYSMQFANYFCQGRQLCLAAAFAIYNGWVGMMVRRLQGCSETASDIQHRLISTWGDGRLTASLIYCSDR